jgi:hypothetical protein
VASWIKETSTPVNRYCPAPAQRLPVPHPCFKPQGIPAHITPKLGDRGHGHPAACQFAEPLLVIPSRR